MGRHIAEGPIDAKRSGASFVERENKGRHVAGEATNSIGRTTLAQSLSVERLKAWYGRESLVLTDVSFVLEAGEAVGLIGLNGAGKTTMLTSLCDVHRRARFEALRYRGREVSPGDEHFKAARYLSLADDDCFPTWNLEAFIGFLERAYRLRSDRGRLEELIEGFDYGRYRTASFSRLSSGSRKKANLIAAFYVHTPILLLDEPVDFLDFTATEFLYRCINDAAASGCSVLLSSHIAESFTRCTRRLYVLSAGRLTGPFATPEDSDAVAALVS